MYSLKQKRSKKRILIIGSVFVFTVATITAGWMVRKNYYDNLRPYSTETKTTIVTIKSGSTADEVALLLQQKKIIRKDWAFTWFVRTKNLRDKLQAGSYAFSPSMSVNEIVNMIVNGKVATNLFTILPAQRIDQIEEAFAKEFVATGSTVAEVEAAFKAGNYSSHPALTDKPKAASLEGYLYPESFQRTSSTSPSEIINASLDEMALALTPEIRAGISRQGLTVHEGVILASIVEKEVSNSNDRAKAAQVFLLRLKKGMLLGSDVTAYYGADIAGLKHSVLTDTPYNTRLHAGLPPGPISNVSKSSLEAIANPSGTDYLYFVAGDDGITYFSHTIQEHEALTAQHCKQLCAE